MMFLLCLLWRPSAQKEGTPESATLLMSSRWVRKKHPSKDLLDPGFPNQKSDIMGISAQVKRRFRRFRVAFDPTWT